MTRLFALTLALTVAACHAAQVSPGPPPGATEQEVMAGRDLYHGLGGCATCHGDAGVGTAEGPELVGGTWQLGDGSLPWLEHMTRHGGLGARSRDDDPQAMRGPTALDSAQVRRVAIYVWSISRGREAPGGQAN